MKDSSYADKIHHWQITVQNIQDAVPTIPGIEPPFTDLRQKVTDLRSAHDNAQMLRGKLREAVVLRRQLDRDTRRSARRLAAVARGHLGFDNPALESFNIRAEGNRARKSGVVAKPEMPIVKGA